MGDSSGTPGVPGIGSDINAVKRNVDSEKTRFLVVGSAPMIFFIKMLFWRVSRKYKVSHIRCS